MSEARADVCPPHRWEITLVRLESGLHDHYRCQVCQAEKDVARASINSWARRGNRTPSRAV